MGARQRLGDRRVVAEEGRLEDLWLDQLGQQLQDDLVRSPGGVERDVVRGGIPAQRLHGRGEGALFADGVADSVVNRQPTPLAAEIDLATPRLPVGTAVLDGEVNIDSATYALQSASARMPKGVNVNWINHLLLENENQLLDEGVWFRKRDKVSAEFSVTQADSSKLVWSVQAADTQATVDTRGAWDAQVTIWGSSGTPDGTVTVYADDGPDAPQVLRDYVEGGTEPAPDGDGCVLACSPLTEASVYMNGRTNAGVYASVRALEIPVLIVRAKLPPPDRHVFDYSSSPTWPGLVGEFRRAREVHLPERTHFLPMECPAEVAALLREALALPAGTP